MRSKTRKLLSLLAGATVLAGFSISASAASGTNAAVFAAPAAKVSPPETSLTLINGWTNSPFGTAASAVTTVSGLVHFEGAIATTGSSPNPFVLPAAFRPATSVYVKVDLCNGANGRLFIDTSGNVTVQAENNFSDAQCFTSLDGPSFARNASGFTPLALINGWSNAAFGTENAAVKSINGVVHFEGAIASGTTANPFVLPAGFRPASEVYVPVDMCNATNGRLIIDPSGTVTVEAETNFSNAQCFTSLDGASFALSSTSFRPLRLIHGWTNAPFSTGNAALRSIGGVVHFEGAIATTGTNAEPFVLPARYRPATNVYVPVDLCNATNGRLDISPSGAVTVQAETNFSNAQCFTSLDGASFAQ